MILVKITGGPGNQIFQYAFGRRLADKNKTRLYLDLSEYDRKKHRSFVLGKFNIRANYADSQILKSFLKFSFYVPYDLRRYVHQAFPKIFKNIIYEKFFHFDKNVISSGNNNYLIGFWQSEKYFNSLRKDLLKEITLKSELSIKGKRVLEQIRKTESVSINVRRGDFLNNLQINQRHGVIDINYFFKAIKFISSRVKNPHFYLFSDDIGWVKENIKPAFPATYVDFNFPDRSEEDLILGSNCRHNILTNSTFSWWVGWLNDNKQKIVIAPKNWFNRLNYSTTDLIPEEWIKLNYS